MGFLKSLFSASQPYRCYVALDQQGLCRAFKQCQQAPVGEGWVEVGDIRPQWLGQPLPAHARVSSRATGASGIRAVHA
ncbi:MULTISPECIES: hypothetical protein [unclassified Pseudomonas]|uniref:hypothetical protein n=1 Tax=unclassified Pseudomonas TaxID=196821 RepID=UPI0017871B62|nr:MULTISPECIES: hypothetical protein [unclassified Pseudomonas]MBD8603699.1 hypothetical protein [Pseudomonas sp. CFBP 8771]MBD8731387.1 hypothetical protein [Pseudomonas sp. CFBP 13710]